MLAFPDIGSHLIAPCLTVTPSSMSLRVACAVVKRRLTRRVDGPRMDLRPCANSDRLASVIDTIASTDEDRNRFAAVARALGDPKRLCVLESLAGGEASVGELASRVSCQVPNMSQHLAVLRSAGLVAARRDGSTVYYRLADAKVLEAYRILQAIAR